MSLMIQIRGTSGSGKTTVMKEVMSLLGNWTPEFIPGRKRPLYYRCVEGGWQDKGIIVLGHYEIDCGGCDTIGSVPQIFEVIKTLPKYGILLCEGLLLSEDVKWSKELGSDLRVVFLATEVEECVRRVKKRREGSGNDKPFNPDNTVNRVRPIERARKLLPESGIIVVRSSVNQASSIILNWIRLHANQRGK